MNGRFLTILVLLVVATGAAALAAEGRIPLYEPTTITTPGDYILTRDIDVSGGGLGIVISVDGVTIDLNGKTLTGNSVFDAISITHGTDAVLGITIRNGSISGGYSAVYASQTGKRRLTFESLRISNTALSGLDLRAVHELKITGCTILDSGVHGILVQNSAGAVKAIIENNIIANSFASGVSLPSLRTSILRGNVIDSFGSVGSDEHGIKIVGDDAFSPGGNLLVDNTVRGGATGSSGIYIGASDHDNILERNNVTGNAGNGMYVSSHRNRIVDGMANDNGQYGILLSGRYNIVERNTIASNGEYGLSCGDFGNAYRDNIFRDNDLGALHTAACEFDVDAGGNLY